MFLPDVKVDLILTRGTPAVTAAKNATRTIPIVMAASGDPLGAGVVTGLARPGGNVTGLTALTAEVSGKRLQLRGAGTSPPAPGLTTSWATIAPRVPRTLSP